VVKQQQPVILTEAECVTVSAALQLAIALYTKNAAFCVDIGQPHMAAQFMKRSEEATRLRAQCRPQLQDDEARGHDKEIA
jgi:hypothetical protein